MRRIGNRVGLKVVLYQLGLSVGAFEVCTHSVDHLLRVAGLRRPTALLVTSWFSCSSGFSSGA